MIKMGIKPFRLLWNTSKKLFPPKDPTPISQQKPLDVWSERPKEGKKNPFLDPGRREKVGLPAALPKPRLA